MGVDYVLDRSGRLRCRRPLEDASVEGTVGSRVSSKLWLLAGEREGRCGSSYGLLVAEIELLDKAATG